MYGPVAIGGLGLSSRCLSTPTREEDHEAYDDPRDGDGPFNGLERSWAEGKDHEANDDQAGDDGGYDAALTAINQVGTRKVGLGPAQPEAGEAGHRAGKYEAQ